jgi:hypothetical protein
MSYLELLDRVLNRLTEPFAKANNLSEYAGRGYWRLGPFLVAGLILLLIGGGYIEGLLSKIPSPLEPYFKLAFEWLHLGPVSGSVSKTAPLSLVLIVLYIAAGLIRRVREAVGGFLANSLYRVVGAMISLGEFCIRWRGLSMILVASLTLTVGLAGKSLLQLADDGRLRERRFNDWLDATEKFVLEDRLLRYNPERQNELVEGLWQRDFETFLRVPGGREHKAKVLHQLLTELRPPQVTNRERGKAVWYDSKAYVLFLSEKRETLNKIAGDCAKNPRRPEGELPRPELPEAELPKPELRACGLVNILMGRLFVRFAEDGQVKPEQIPYSLETASVHYDRVESSRLDASDRKSPQYEFAVRNGEANITLLWCDYLLNSGSSHGNGPFPDVPTCLATAYRSYKELKDGEEEKASEAKGKSEEEKKALECSHRMQAIANNWTDLFARIGLYHEKVEGALEWKLDKEVYQLIKDRNLLRQKIKGNVEKMMSCVSEDEPLPDVVTVAQAYGACVHLATLDAGRPQEMMEREALAKEREALAKATGKYLLLANSHEPGLFKSWGLTYFCDIKNDAHLQSVFREAIADEAFESLPKVDIDGLLAAIDECPQPTPASPERRGPGQRAPARPLKSGPEGS